jgi:DinB superfamily
MFDREVRLNGLLFRLLQKLLLDIDDSLLSRPLADNGNPPAFTLGHLAIVNDYALKSFGEPRLAPAEWHKRFRPGASPKDDPSPLPSKAELLQLLETGGQKIREAATKADPERMNQPHNSDFFKDTPVKTVADTVAHLMTSHFAFHIGQISAWRRLQGKPPLF